MSLHFKCSQCGKALTAPESQAGMTVKCPQCGELLRVASEDRHAQDAGSTEDTGTQPDALAQPDAEREPAEDAPGPVAEPRQDEEPPTEDRLPGRWAWLRRVSLGTRVTVILALLAILALGLFPPCYVGRSGLSRRFVFSARGIDYWHLLLEWGCVALTASVLLAAKALLPAALLNRAKEPLAHAFARAMGAAGRARRAVAAWARRHWRGLCIGGASVAVVLVAVLLSPWPWRWLRRYEVVVDEQTGLMWTVEPSGFVPWQTAQEYTEELDAGGYSDWRLPTMDEVKTQVAFYEWGPAYLRPGFAKAIAGPPTSIFSEVLQEDAREAPQRRGDPELNELLRNHRQKQAEAQKPPPNSFLARMREKRKGEGAALWLKSGKCWPVENMPHVSLSAVDEAKALIGEWPAEPPGLRDCRVLAVRGTAGLDVLADASARWDNAYAELLNRKSAWRAAQARAAEAKREKAKQAEAEARRLLVEQQAREKRRLAEQRAEEERWQAKQLKGLEYSHFWGWGMIREGEASRSGNVLYCKIYNGSEGRLRGFTARVTYLRNGVRAHRDIDLSCGQGAKSVDSYRVDAGVSQEEFAALEIVAAKFERP